MSLVHQVSHSLFVVVSYSAQLSGMLHLPQPVAKEVIKKIVFSYYKGTGREINCVLDTVLLLRPSDVSLAYAAGRRDPPTLRNRTVSDYTKSTGRRQSTNQHTHTHHPCNNCRIFLHRDILESFPQRRYSVLLLQSQQRQVNKGSLKR